MKYRIVYGDKKMVSRKISLFVYAYLNMYFITIGLILFGVF